MPRAKTGGRKKGVQNKITTNVKANVIQVFDDIGGVENMATWAAENPTQFYNLYAKLLPLQVAGDPDQPLVIKINKDDAKL